MDALYGLVVPLWSEDDLSMSFFDWTASFPGDIGVCDEGNYFRIHTTAHNPQSIWTDILPEAVVMRIQRVLDAKEGKECRWKILKIPN